MKVGHPDFGAEQVPVRAGERDAGRPRRVGYVVSTYPAYSHAFIETEVETLTAAGWRVHTFSINRPDFDDPRGPGSTTVVKSQPLTAWIMATGRALRLSPSALLWTALIALRSGLRRPDRVKGAVWGLAYVLEAMVVFDTARRERLTHLHAHFANNGADIARLAAGFGRRAARAGVEHSGPTTWSITVHGPSDFDDAAQSDLTGKVLSARDVVCISDFARSALIDLVPAVALKARVVRMGVVLPPRPGARVGRDGPVRVLFVGRMVQKKAPDVLLESLGRLAGIASIEGSGGPALEATFVGAGPLVAPLMTRAHEVDAAVRFAGALPHEQVLQQYAEHDVFCLPSFSEGLPVVLMEAMASGIVVVTTPVAGIPELVEDGVTGLLVPPGDAVALAGAIRRLALDPQLRAELADQARIAVEQMHDATSSAGALAEVFGGAASGNSARKPDEVDG